MTRKKNKTSDYNARKEKKKGKIDVKKKKTQERHARKKNKSFIKTNKVKKKKDTQSFFIDLHQVPDHD